MDVILARLDQQQLRRYCIDAVQQELQEAHRLLTQTLESTRRLKEVHDAATALSFLVFQEDPELSNQLRRLRGVHHSIRKCIKGMTKKDNATNSDSVRRGRPHLIKNETGDVQDSAPDGHPATVDLCDSDSDVSILARNDQSEESSASETESECDSMLPPVPKKRRLSTGSATKATPPKRQTFEELLALAQLETLNQSMKEDVITAAEHTIELRKRRGDARDATWELFTEQVISMLSYPTKLPKTSPVVALIERIVEYFVGIAIKGKPAVPRESLKNLIVNLAQFSVSTSVLPRQLAGLRYHFNTRFVLRGDEIRDYHERLENAIQTVSDWERGGYTVVDVDSQIEFIREIMDARFKKWNPCADCKVLTLIDLLISKLGAFRTSSLQQQRFETLISWQQRCEKAIGVSERQKQPQIASRREVMESPAHHATKNSSVVGRPIPEPPTISNVSDTEVVEEKRDKMRTTDGGVEKKKKKKKKNKKMVPIRP